MTKQIKYSASHKQLKQTSFWGNDSCWQSRYISKTMSPQRQRSNAKCQKTSVKMTCNITAAGMMLIKLGMAQTP